jgi:HK97 family phage major capsid protein
METPEFQKQVLDTLGEQKKSHETLIANFDRLDKETKKAFEDFTKEKNMFATTKNIDEVLRKMSLVQAHLKREARAAWGSPAQLISRDPGLRRAFVAKLVNELQLRELLGKDAPIMKDLDTGNTPGSTYIDNNELEREIYDSLMRFGAYRTLDVRMIGAKATEIRIKTARILATFIDEAAAIGADATKAGTKTAVTAKKIAALISVSNELMEDDVAGLVEDILDDLFEAVAYRLDWISFTADGTADAVDGGFTGMFFGGTAAVAVGGNVSVQTLDYDDFVKPLTVVDPGVLSRAAAWWMHPTLLAFALYIKDLNGRPIFNTAIESPSFGAIGTIIGFPVHLVGAAPSTNGVSAKVAAFGDPKNQAVRIRRDLRVDRSEQWAFNTDELTFRGVVRAATKTKIATATAILTTAAA